MRLIAVGGESTAFGYYDEEDRNGWAGRLQSHAMKLTQRHPTDPTVVRNYAMPGRTISRVSGELVSELERWKRAGEVVAVLSVGSNEAKIQRGRQRPVVSVEVFGNYLADYAASAARLAVPTIYVGLTPVMESRTHPTVTGATIEDDLIEEYDGVVQEFAAATNMPYVPTRPLLLDRGLDNTLAFDGCHPNALGHALIAAAVHSELVKMDIFEY